MPRLLCNRLIILFSFDVPLPALLHYLGIPKKAALRKGAEPKEKRGTFRALCVCSQSNAHTRSQKTNGKEKKKKLWYQLQKAGVGKALQQPQTAPEQQHSLSAALSRKDDANDQTVQGQGLGKNENEDHSHEQLRLLSVSPDPAITNDADGHARTKTAQAAGQARGQVGVPVEHLVVLRSRWPGSNKGRGGKEEFARCERKGPEERGSEFPP